MAEQKMTLSGLVGEVGSLAVRFGDIEWRLTLMLSALEGSGPDSGAAQKDGAPGGIVPSLDDHVRRGAASTNRCHLLLDQIERALGVGTDTPGIPSGASTLGVAR